MRVSVEFEKKNKWDLKNLLDTSPLFDTLAFLQKHYSPSKFPHLFPFDAPSILWTSLRIDGYRIASVFFHLTMDNKTIEKGMQNR